MREEAYEALDFAEIALLLYSSQHVEAEKAESEVPIWSF